jgi:hypothetical protein
MRRLILIKHLFVRLKIAFCIFALCLTHFAAAQNATAPEKIAETKKAEPIVTATSTKKMVQDATINLQTTVTGNQEQPRVLYILPWQSPAADDVDFESLENQQASVFDHVERDELRRELDVAEE